MSEHNTTRRCPFNGDPDAPYVEPNEPCPVCGDYGDERAHEQPSRCVHQDDAEQGAEVARLRAENERLREGIKRVVLAYGDAGWAKSDFCRDLRILIGMSVEEVKRERAR